MTRDYSKGKIYKIEPIVDHEENEIYIGCTTKEYLSQRMTKHRDDYGRYTKGKIKKTMRSFDLFDKYGVKNCTILLLESVNASCKDELLSREGYYIRNMKCINKIVPGRTLDEVKENAKQYREQHKNKNNIYQKQYRELNKNKTIDYQKQYREQNKSHIKEKQKQYNELNKEIINAKRSIKILCNCGCEISKRNIAAHWKTKSHLNKMSHENVCL